MSKWLKLMKKIEASPENTSVVSHSIHPEDSASSENHDLFQMMAMVVMLLAVVLTFKTMSNGEINQKQTAQLVLQFDAQQEQIHRLKTELGTYQKSNLAAIQNHLNSDNQDIENLSLENASLKVRVRELEAFEQQMIDEMLILTKDQADQKAQLTDGRNI